MKGQDGKNLNVIEGIAAHYVQFGIQLLQDANGTKVEVIKRNHIHEGVEEITRAILRQWLANGGPTCTYSYLIDCIKAVRLETLAGNLEDSLKYNRQ